MKARCRMQPISYVPQQRKYRVIKQPGNECEEKLRVSNIETPISAISLYIMVFGESFLGSRSKETRTTSHRGLFRQRQRIDCSCSNPFHGKSIPEPMIAFIFFHLVM